MNYISYTENVYITRVVLAMFFSRKRYINHREISKIVMEPVYYYSSMIFFRLVSPLTNFLSDFQDSVSLLPLAKYFAQCDLSYFFSKFEYENFQTYRKFEILAY